jgi:hypothetical protein
MTEKKIPPGERIASSFKKLAASSTDLNAAAAELGQSIEKLDRALGRLNLCVSAWHKIAGAEDRNGPYWSRDIGYARVGKHWGIALRSVSGDEFLGDRDEEVWLFNDAPPWMRVESAGRIPDLFDELIKRAEDTTSKMKARSAEANELAKAVTAARFELEAE